MDNEVRDNVEFVKPIERREIVCFLEACGEMLEEIDKACMAADSRPAVKTALLKAADAIAEAMHKVRILNYGVACRVEVTA